LGFPFNICATVEAIAATSYLACSWALLGFAKAHHKTTLRGKVGVALGKRSFQIVGVSHVSATAAVL